MRLGPSISLVKVQRPPTIAQGVLSAFGGYYTVSYGDATFVRGGGAIRTIAAVGGSWNFSGGDAALKPSRKLIAEGGSYGVTYGAATLARSTINHYTLTAEGGSWNFSGGTMGRAFSIISTGMSYNFSGGDAALTYSPAGGPITVTWDQNVAGMTDNGGGTVTSNGGAYTFGARTAQTITGDGEYFEFTYEGKQIWVGIDTGVFGSHTLAEIEYTITFFGSGNADITYRANPTSGSTYLGSTSVNPVAGDVFRFEISGTSLLVKHNGSTIVTATGQTFSFPYRGRVYGTNDAGPYSISSAKITASSATYSLAADGLSYNFSGGDATLTYTPIGGGSGTVTWNQNVQGMTDSGGGTVTANGSQYIFGARTAETLTDGQYFEFTYQGNQVFVGLDSGAFGSHTLTEIEYYGAFLGSGSVSFYRRIGGGSAFYLGETGGGASAPVAGDVIRMELSGTTLTVKKNGVAFITASSETFSFPYRGRVYGGNDSGTYTISSAKIGTI